jgi:small subunit ribosomal protein S7
MPRRTQIAPREQQADAVFGSAIVTRFINMLMKGGKKTVAERIFYGAMQLIQERTGRNPLEVLQETMSNVMPYLEVRPRRVGGATYQIPMEVPTRRQVTLALRWIVAAARDRQEKTMGERLAEELIDASNEEGAAVRRRQEMQRMAAANKAYAHYRW